MHRLCKCNVPYASLTKSAIASHMLQGKRASPSSAKALAAEETPKVLSVPLLSDVVGDFLGGFRHFVCFSSSKTAVKGKSRQKEWDFLVLASAQGVKVFSQCNLAEVSAFTLRLSLYWCASISTSPAPVLTVSPWLNISNKSAKISPIPGCWLACCYLLPRET